METHYFFPLILFSLFLIYLIVRPITVLVHELGHGLSSIFFSKQKVTLYIGSYGDSKRTIKATIGRLEIYFKYYPFYWKVGCCIIPSDISSLTHHLLITIAGPAFSLLFSFFACFIAFYLDVHASIKLVSVIFFGSGMMDFFISINPSSKPMIQNNGTPFYNDGYQLMRLLVLKKCQKGIKLLEQSKDSEAAIFFDKTIKYSKKNDLIYRMAFACYIDQKDYSKAQVICEIIRKEGYNLTSDELVNTGFIYGKFNKYEEA